MTTHHFDETQLEIKLGQVSWQHRVAFAASCAERLMPAYVAFSKRSGRGDPAALRGMLTQLWDDLAGNRLDDGELRSKIDACMALIPQEDDAPWLMEQAAAEDAGAAVAYALRCRQSGQAKEATWAARRTYEALDHYVINRENIDTTKPGAEERVLGHPLVQRELARQRRDLDEILCVGDTEVQEVAARLRDRAVTEGTNVFGGTS